MCIHTSSILTLYIVYVLVFAFLTLYTQTWAAASPTMDSEEPRSVLFIFLSSQ